MLYSKRSNLHQIQLSLQINNKNVQSGNEFNFLGPHLSSKLNCMAMSKKNSCAVGIMNKMQIVFPRVILLSL